YKGDHKCGTPHLTEDQIKGGFISAFNRLMDDRDRILEDCRMAQSMLCDTKKIDAELAQLRQEVEVVAELSRKEIHRSAHNLECQEASESQVYLERYEQARGRIEALEQEKLERTAKKKAIGRFIRSINGTAMLITEFDETLWTAVVDSITITIDGEMIFRFKNGLKIMI
ncbi:MAG TPA: recombinase family protein, partial [Candidatus Limiplasma sp.]|nr:recombinase family protein [Candidatus Limiplasma sp.]